MLLPELQPPGYGRLHPHREAFTAVLTRDSQWHEHNCIVAAHIPEHICAHRPLNVLPRLLLAPSAELQPTLTSFPNALYAPSLGAASMLQTPAPSQRDI